MNQTIELGDFDLDVKELLDGLGQSLLTGGVGAMIGIVVATTEVRNELCPPGDMFNSCAASAFDAGRHLAMNAGAIAFVGLVLTGLVVVYGGDD